VAPQLGIESCEVELIQSGTVYEAGEMITNPMKDIVLKHCPNALLKRLDGSPVVGAVMVRMDAAGFDGYAVRDRMLRTAEESTK
jgi:hypothetical protein